MAILLNLVSMSETWCQLHFSVLWMALPNAGTFLATMKSSGLVNCFRFECLLLIRRSVSCWLGLIGIWMSRYFKYVQCFGSSCSNHLIYFLQYLIYSLDGKSDAFWMREVKETLNTPISIKVFKLQLLIWILLKNCIESNRTTSSKPPKDEKNVFKLRNNLKH